MVLYVTYRNNLAKFPYQYRTGHLVRNIIWSRLDFLFERGCFLHYFQHNDPEFLILLLNISLAFFLAYFLLGVLYCTAVVQDTLQKTGKLAKAAFLIQDRVLSTL